MHGFFDFHHSDVTGHDHGTIDGQPFDGHVDPVTHEYVGSVGGESLHSTHSDVTGGDHGAIGGQPFDGHDSGVTGDYSGHVGNDPFTVHHSEVTGHDTGTVGDTHFDASHDPVTGSYGGHVVPAFNHHLDPVTGHPVNVSSYDSLGITNPF